MNLHETIKQKLGAKTTTTPPILCWMGTGRHKLYEDEGVGRKLIAELLGELEFNKGAEIGVDRGYYSKLLLESNPKLQLICVDPWEGKRAEEHLADCTARLNPYWGRIILMREKSLNASKQIEENSLDFVYIDSKREFNAIMMDLIDWGRKVKPGGLLIARGYCNMFETGVMRAVDAYTYAHYIRDWYITRELEPNALIPITHKT